MVYGILQLINFAHGDVYMVGAYAGYFCMTSLSLGFFEALIIAMATCSLLGVIIERVAYRPLRGSSRITLLITAIGVSLILEYTMMYFVGARVRSYPPLPAFMAGSFHVGGVVIKNLQLLIIGISVGLMILLQFIVKKTSVGKAMRAVSQDMEAARLMGISVDNTISVTFALGSALAAIGAVLYSTAYPSVSPTMGSLPGLKAFIAAVLGGIGVLPGAMLGGFIMGIAESLTKGFISSQLADAVVFGILIVVLLVKPSGIMGRSTHEKV